MKNSLITLSLFLTTFSVVTTAQLSVDLETGGVFVQKNDVSSSWKNSSGELNGLDGTLFSFPGAFNNPVKPLVRLRGSYSFGKDQRHFISFLAAPLQYRCIGSFQDTVIFNSKIYSPGTSVEGFYKFSGYRLTYRYLITNSPKLTFGLGLTLNLRDAEFSLTQGNQFERNYNRGVVPLVNTYLNFSLTKNIGLLIDGDVFYIDKTGGAIDYLSGINYTLDPKLSIKLGYRFFSGVGSEEGNVYNKLFVSSAVIGAVVKF